MDGTAQYDAECARLGRELAGVRAAGGAVRLGKTTSNLFRARRPARQGLDVRAFGHVFAVDPDCCIADTGGMTAYDAVVGETLRHGLLPQVTPELKSITAGGAVSGIGIESSSFRFGLVHETVESMDVLLANGAVVRCSRDENSDLFCGLPNSHGTLGYVLRLRLRLMRAAPYVHVTHERFSDMEPFFLAIADRSERVGIDFLDGTVFGRGEMYITSGRFAMTAPRVSDYSWMNIYYQSIRCNSEDWLTAAGYVWRWDTDWFWCSRQFGVQNPVLRLLATKRLLNSRTYGAIMRLSHRWMPSSGGTESVIQDVDIPVAGAPEFLDFLLREIGITPVWICPLRAGPVSYPLYRLNPGSLYINFGFWDVIPSAYASGHFNRKVERKMLDLGGKKGLYSSVHLDEDKFWSVYNRNAYEKLKDKYDPDWALSDLYTKVAHTEPGA